jgi:hypothetical protein
MPDRRGRRALPPTRREHWRAVIGVVVVLLVCLVVGEVVDQVVKSSPGVGRRTNETWVAAVAALVDESNTLSPMLRDVRAHATDPAAFDRVTLQFALAELKRGAASEATMYRTLGLAAPSSSAGALASAALNLRYEGVESLARGIGLAISRPTGRPPLARAARSLVAAGSRLVAADAAYRELVTSLRGSGGARHLPSSVWVLAPGVWSASSAGAWAGELRSAANLAFAPALSIVALALVPPPLNITGLPTTTTTTLVTTTTTLVTTTTTLVTTTTTTTTTLPATTTTRSPKGHALFQATTTTSSTTTTSPGTVGSSTPANSRPASTTTTSTLPGVTTTLQIPPAGSVSVVAATAQLEVVVIVKNTGDTTARGAAVTAVLSPSGASHAGAARVSCRHRLLVLAPGTSQYMVMPKLAVRHATSYELVVTATIPGGAPTARSLALYVSS